MAVIVLHHARCFDGAASAAIFAVFYKEHIDADAELIFRPKMHAQGDPFVDEDFAADTVACLDFRYTARPGLDWYFDHHKSAFQLAGEREHFEADQSGTKFHDPTAPCCATYMAQILAERWGFDTSRFDELLHWAQTIDTASFSSPDVPVAMREPAMQLAAFIQSAEDPADIERFIADLVVVPFDELCQRPYIRNVVAARLESHAHDCERIQAVSKVERGVLEYDLLDEAPRVLSHFIPYAQQPDVDYVVGVYPHADGDLRLTVGYNPWHDPAARKHNLASLCEEHGGGGHPFVAGCSFALDQQDQCRAAQRAMLQRLRAAAES